MKKPIKKLVYILSLLVALIVISLFASNEWQKEDREYLHLEMVFVKGGTFTMGPSSPEMDFGYDEEYPAHEVTVSGYYISKYPITIYQYKQFVEDTGYLTDAERGYSFQGDGTNYGSVIITDGFEGICPGISWRCDESGQLIDSLDWNRPVSHLSWNDAVAFCKWMSDCSGMLYRLPTEAEWEYAAKGGRESKGYIFSGSNDLNEVAWGRFNSKRQTHPVGQKKPNELGIYDMSGNVWEWCLDYFAPYPEEAQINPTGPDIARTRFRNRVMRGGSFYRYDSYCRVCARLKITEKDRGKESGFRVVLIPQASE